MSEPSSNRTVLCGLPGDLEYNSDAKDHKVAKVGGQPVFPGLAPPSTPLVTCHNCQNRMVLVVQVPTAAQPANFTGVLMLWACISPECAKGVSSWRAFSCQLPSNTQAESNKVAQSTQDIRNDLFAVESPSCPDMNNVDNTLQQSQAGDAWGATDDSWGSQTHKQNDASQGNDVFDFSDLEQALHKSHQQQIMPAPHSQLAEAITQPCGHQLQTASCCSLSPDMAGPQLPGFYLHLTAEAVGASSSMSAEDQHIAELVTAYQQGNQQSGPSHAMDGPGDEWSGEMYEEDKEGAFLKFCAQVQHVPQQCLRYRYANVITCLYKQLPL
ncbi:TPA: programmed cell death protein, variant 2 [Trebouxia sp. C0004]